MVSKEGVWVRYAGQHQQDTEKVTRNITKIVKEKNYTKNKG